MQVDAYSDQIDHLKQCVAKMLDADLSAAAGGSWAPAPIWAEGLGILSYALNLTAQDFLNIRLHTSLITGEPVFQYWHAYPPVDPEQFADKIGYKFYTESVPEAYWVGEPVAPWVPRPIGIDYRGRTINANITRYQSCISNLYLSGVLPAIQRESRRSIVVEVGGGYGGLAHALGTILSSRTTYVIVDLPLTLLFSGGYLIVNNPGKRIYVYDEATFNPQFLESEILDYDYVLLPNFVLKELYRLHEINLLINTQSFQEMTREQVSEYLDFGRAKLRGYLYSDNVDSHPFNSDLAQVTLTSLLAARFSLFPNPATFEISVPASKQPWFYKPYIGIPKKSTLQLDPNATMRFIGGGRYEISA